MNRAFTLVIVFLSIPTLAQTVNHNLTVENNLTLLSPPANSFLQTNASKIVGPAHAADATHDGYLTSGDWFTFSSIQGLPVQTGQAGKYLTTDGTTASWGTVVSGVTSVNGYTGAVTLTKTDLGLSNVDNTSDVNKPVSTAQATALGLKRDNAFTPTTPSEWFVVPANIQDAIDNLANQTNGAPNTFAGFDAAGILYTIPGWQITPDNGFDVNQNVDETNNTWSNYNINVVPTASTTNYRGIMSIQTALDPTNTGFMIGSGYDGGVGLLNLGFRHDSGSTSSIGQTSVINTDSHFGNGTDAASMDNYTAFGAYTTLENNYSLRQWTGLNINANFKPGSSVSYFSAIQANFQMDGIIQTNGNFNSLSANGNWNPSNSANANVSGANIGINVSGPVQYYNAFADFTNITSTGDVQGNYTSMSLQPRAVAGSVMNGYTGINLNPNIPAGVLAGNPTGVQIDLSNVVSTQQKQGLTVNDGGVQIQSNYDTAQLSPGGEFQLNLIGGNFKISPGHPITDGSFGFGNNMGPTLDLEDDMGVDATGIGIGIAVNGLVNQIGVADGKTIAQVNYVFVGAGAVSGGPLGTGNITNLNLVAAAGVLPQGSPIFSVTNLKAFTDSPILCLTATNCWGIFIQDTNADNYFAKDVVIGGTTGKPTQASNALDVTGNAQISGVLQLPVQPVSSTPTCATTADDGKIAITSLHLLCICNGSTPGWFHASNGALSCAF